MDHQTELTRIKTEYDRRSHDPHLASLYTFFNPGHLFTVQNRERALLRLLKKFGYHNLAQKKILDIGCGEGGNLLSLTQYGANPARLTGVDLLGPWLLAARQKLPHALHSQVNAGQLPFAGERFDLIFIFTVLTSVLDAGLKQAIAAEAWRALAPGGAIIVYDFKTSGKNRHIQGVSPAEIRSLFPRARITIQRVSLQMGIAWRVAPRSWLVTTLLEQLSFLRTHYLAVIQK